ncbi:MULTISPECIES: sensor histidine kinase [Sphingobacterium]|uniref:sensor histidine kinase n=1 Tax=Sphingobacterium TaxID=28453 RepID=UPI00257DF838|nr:MULTISPECIES: sensor histidine kinase [Sphingobacterium]
MGEISFKVSARTAQLIGQQNFSTAEGAVVELVKNCYDADAKNAILVFNNIDSDVANQSLIIIDNGNGMTQEIIQDNWMMIGTDNKEEDYQTDSGRIKTGAKGIGRFALDRLGTVTDMYTLPKDSNDGLYWKVDWSDFNKKGAAINDIKAILENEKELELTKKLFSLVGDLPELSNYISNNGITFKNGTLIKISNLKDEWDFENITKLFENLEILTPPKEHPLFSISLFSKANPDLFGELEGAYYDDYDYKVSATFENNEDQIVQIDVERNELDNDLVEKNYKEVFSLKEMTNFPFDFETFKKKRFSYKINLSELVKGLKEIDTHNLLKKTGGFSFSFYYLKNSKSDDKSDSDVKKFPYKDFNSSNRRAWLKKFGGIKIFRDDFRIRPYGEYGQDWLKLGERQAQSPQGAGQRLGAYRIRPNQISGTVHISRLTNLSFQDKSGREGIQENEVFDLFKSLLIGIINEFERDRNIIMYSFSQLHKARNKAEQDRIKAEEEANRILEEAKKNEGPIENQNLPQNPSTPDENGILTPNEKNKVPSDAEIALASTYQIQKEEIEEKDNEIRLLRSLSGTGLIVATFAHELRSLRTLLISRTEDLKKVLETNCDYAILNALPSEKNPFTMLNYMRDQDIQIKHWLDYSLSALKKDKRKRTNLDLTEYFKSFYDNWRSALNRRKISLKIHNNLNSPKKIRAFTIDFDTIFNNLLINSLDSFKRRKDGEKRQVNIVLDYKDDFIVIIFGDNGAGLAEDFKKKPEDIFIAFETSKVDKRGNKIGTGIGMYLAKSIIEEYDGKMEILQIEDGFKLGIYLPLRKD